MIGASNQNRRNAPSPNQNHNNNGQQQQQGFPNLNNGAGDNDNNNNNENNQIQLPGPPPHHLNLQHHPHAHHHHHQQIHPGPFAASLPTASEPGVGFLGAAGRNISSQQSCLTKIEPILLSQRWRVENFASVMKLSKPGACLRSQAFKHAKFPLACWQLCLYPGGKRDENQGFVSLFLKMSAIQPGGEVYQKAEYLFYFLDDHNVPRFSNVNIGEFHAKPPKGGHSWGLRNIPRSKIINSLQGDGSLLILCEVELLPDMKLVRAQEDRACTKAVNPSNLVKVSQTYLSSQEKMFTSGAFADYTVEVPKSSDNPGKEFKVHRSVLAAHSEVFQAMFLHDDLQEAIDGRILLPDYNVQSVHSFLKYLYTGQVTEAELEECGDELLALSDKYGVNGLKGVSEDFLVSKIEISNVCQLIALADLHGADILKHGCESLIGSHRKDIVNSPPWSELKARDPKLTTEILERLMASEAGGSSSGPPVAKRLKS